MTASSVITPQRHANHDPWRVYTVTIRDIETELKDVSTYDLEFQDAYTRSNFRFAPGQFNMLYLPGIGEMAISISDDPDNRESCRHTIRIAGNVTKSLAKLGIGETLGLRGPFGTSWPIAECIGRDVVVIAGGIGLAPLRPAIFELLNHRKHFGRLNLLYGARSPDSLLYAKLFNDWSQRGMTVQSIVDRADANWDGNVGVVTLLLDRLQSFDPRNTILLCCGPEPMMKYVVATASRRGLSPMQIWLAMERNMQCAVGLCGHCQLGPAFICKDGPIYRFSEIQPFIDVEGL